MEIKKHLLITGNSNVSWKDAIVKAIAETSKTIDYLSEVKVLDPGAAIEKLLYSISPIPLPYLYAML